MSVTILLGDCLDRLREMADDSVDSIVTDPPYGLSFMAKKWDYDVPSVAIWAECLRVLKPGGHLLAFAGTRTQHRMAVRIEDAGFEIRDMIAWVYSSGFPKSHNLDNLKGKTICGCERASEPAPECDMRPLRGADISKAKHAGTECGEVLQPSLPQCGPSFEGREQFPGTEARPRQSGMEGRRDLPSAARELCVGPICACAGVGGAHGEGGRVCDGASASHGGVVRLSPHADGMCPSSGPQSVDERAVESGTLAGQPQPQDGGVWPHCGRCGLPVVPEGLGTALKPALEPITVARKPLIGTVAENVLAHGVGAINVDGCRVHADDAQGGEYTVKRLKPGATLNKTGGNWRPEEGVDYHGEMKPGRWPANLIHDGSDEVLAAFPEAKGAQAPVKGTEPTGHGFSGTVYGHGGKQGRQPSDQRDGGGSAARFFYCAKASKADRDDGLDQFAAWSSAASEFRPSYTEGAERGEDGTPFGRWSPQKNHHPTVKPTDLMRYLCRLVTPPGGTVLDPFMGSGSTGRGAVLEGFGFIGIEREQEFVQIARARVAASQRSAGVPDEELAAVSVEPRAPKPQQPKKDAAQIDMFSWMEAHS